MFETTNQNMVGWDIVNWYFWHILTGDKWTYCRWGSFEYTENMWYVGGTFWALGQVTIARLFLSMAKWSGVSPGNAAGIPNLIGQSCVHQKSRTPISARAGYNLEFQKKQNPTTAAAWQRPLTSTHRTAFPLWLLYQNANMIGKLYQVLPPQRKPLYPGHSSVLCPIVGLVVPGYTYLASGGEPFTRIELLWFKEIIFRSTFSTIQKYIYLSFPYFLFKQRFVSK